MKVHKINVAIRFAVEVLKLCQCVSALFNFAVPLYFICGLFILYYISNLIVKQNRSEDSLIFVTLQSLQRRTITCTDSSIIHTEQVGQYIIGYGSCRCTISSPH